MEKHVCDLCGYEYNPEAGDPEGNIKQGTQFEDLPDTWVCPQCGVSKDGFKKVKSPPNRTKKYHKKCFYLFDRICRRWGCR